MRFGIMDLQISDLVPDLSTLAPRARSAAEIQSSYVHHIASFTQAPLVRRLAAAGFKLIELGSDLSLFFPQAFTRSDIAQLAEAKQELGLSYTVHLPLWSIEPSTPSRPVREGSVRAIVDIINATKPLDPEMYALHATGALAAEFYHMHLPETARPLLMQLFADNARESIKTIVQETGIPSRQLTIETIEFPFELTLQVAEALDTSITFDTGHVLSGFSGPVDFFDALSRALPRLGEVHLHDSPQLRPEQAIVYGKDHQRLGAGDLDVARLLDVLTAAHFGGPIIFELTVEEALDSLKWVRTVRPDSIS